jgi:hypothetical protein
MARYGKGRRRFTRKHPEALTINQLIPVGFVIGLCLLTLSLLLCLLFGITVPLFFSAVPYSLYLLLVTTVTIKITIRDGIQYAIPVPAILFAIHVALGYGFLKEAAYGLINSQAELT